MYSGEGGLLQEIVRLIRHLCRNPMDFLERSNSSKFSLPRPLLPSLMNSGFMYVPFLTRSRQIFSPLLQESYARNQI